MPIAPVLAIVVCHEGAEWLSAGLPGLGKGTVRPRHILAVDTGSTDDTSELLARAREDGVIDDVLTLAASSGFADAVDAAVRHADQSFSDPDEWIWVLHDDSAPEPECLSTLLLASDASPSAGVLGPIAVDWEDPRLIVEAGLSTDASGNRRTDVGLGGSMLREQSSEVLAVPSAGALIKRELWDELDGFDRDFALLREDLDFGWRANLAGRTVLCVPRARIRHARALSNGERVDSALGGSGVHPPTTAAVDRAYGLRTFLANCSRLSYLVGIPRLVVLCVLRGIGFTVLRSSERARAEFAALSYLTGGRAGLKEARTVRAGQLARAAARQDGTRKSRRTGSVRGLFIGRFTRMRLAVRAAVLYLVRRRIASDAALGTLPDSTGSAHSSWVPPEDLRAAAFGGGQAKDVVAVSVEEDYEPELSGAGQGTSAPAAGELVTARVDEDDETAAGAGAVRAEEDAAETTAADTAVETAAEKDAGETAGADTATDTADSTAPAEAPEETTPAPAERRPSPGLSAGRPGLVFVEVNRRRVLAATLFAPPVLLILGLTALALVVNWQRLGLDLVGGRLLPVPGLGDVWSSYLAGWHSAGGGTSAQAPAALAVIGALGLPAWPLGGPAAAVALLFLLDIPLAALAFYAASRRLPVHRWTRASLAVVYALLPPATAAVAQGRLDVVVVHLLLPLIVAGVTTVLRPVDSGSRWLSASVTVALGVAVLGGFSPLTHLLVLLGLLSGFVLVHSPTSMGRRIASVSVVVLLPIALLLPWPATLINNPAIALHGLGARVPALPVGPGELFSLDPGGLGAMPVGAVLIIAVVIGLVVRPTTRVLAGAGVAVLGVGGVVLLSTVAMAPVNGGEPRLGWTGAPLLVVGFGLLLMLLAITRTEKVGAHAKRPARSVRLVTVAAGLAVLTVFAVSAVLVGSDGPLRRADTSGLAAPIASELEDEGRYVLELRLDGDPPRMSAGGMPVFGDDDLAVPEDTPSRLFGWQSTLIGGQGLPPGPPQAVRDVLASAATAGVEFVVLPYGMDPGGIMNGGGELVTTAAPTEDGRQVVRLKSTGGQVTLIAPELSKLAVGGKAPTGDIEGEGVSVVEATLPDVRVRVSDGPGGRLLVLAASLEPGWRAKVNGKIVPIVPAWGHQVGVEVPTRSTDVVVDNPKTVRTTLLLVQVGAVLFTLLTAIPARRPRDERVRRK